MSAGIFTPQLFCETAAAAALADFGGLGGGRNARQSSLQQSFIHYLLLTHCILTTLL
jgi:hypothetical protein